MKKIEIFEQAMCCPTGVCGPAIDPELLRMSFIMNNLKNTSVSAERFNLTNNPDVFVNNKAVNDLLMTDGMDSLPATFVGGELVLKGSYPTTAQFAEWSGLNEEELVKKPKLRISIGVDK
ncbi:arsenite efflux transporter metallochaperone ArsD [Solibacillus daqui]|uniref:arsenite efflux transporter metallochaperone ArsD n=1 Tax=Solibacillus daqui TaxID=2912187 RepID=UPI0023669B60|nr:arsenite efflux transporter metallochaperone ArsD [Solibacillus daqui]